MTEQKIDAKITITAQYNDNIYIKIRDKKSNVVFVEMELTREQFVNAAMNRLAECDVKYATVRSLNAVGKEMVQQPFTFEIPDANDEACAIVIAKASCPEGWVPDLYFRSQTSFFNKDGKHYARTMIRRWI
jgi:hypothetical protein